MEIRNPNIEMADESTATVTPDLTWQRYIVDSFLASTCKRVPYEELDFTIYKNGNHVAFMTNERRLPVWIEAIYKKYMEYANNNTELCCKWLEQRNQNNENKSDKVTVHLCSAEKDNLLTITVDITTGRIDVQGRITKQWGSLEFDHLLNMVNEPQDKWDLEKTKLFSENIFHKGKLAKPSTPAGKTDTTIDQTKESSTSPNREKSFGMIKSQVATLEAEFILYKENNSKHINELLDHLQQKDVAINCLQNELSELQKINKHKQEAICDLTIQQSEMENKIQGLNNKQKKLEENYANLIILMHKQEETITTLTSTPTALTSDNEIIPNIPTSNSFLALDHHADRNETEAMADDIRDNDEPTSYQQVSEQSPQEASQQLTQQATQEVPQQPTQEISQEAPQQASQQSIHPIPQQVSPQVIQPTSQQTSPQTSQQASPQTTQPASQQTSHQTIANRENHSINTQTVILCDSNGRFIKPDILCPDSTTNYIRCPTLSEAKEFLNEGKLHNVKTFIIHTGTNDLEHHHLNHHLLLKYKEIIKTIRDKYPESRILISSLLPRKDILNKRVSDLNKNLQEIVNEFPNTILIKHNNIHKEDLHDRKHLSQQAVKKFAKNIKASYFNTTPKRAPRTRMSGRPFITPNSYPTFSNPPQIPLPNYPYPLPTHASSKLLPTHLNHQGKQEIPSPSLFNNFPQSPLHPNPFPPFTHPTSKSPPMYLNPLRKQEIPLPPPSSNNTPLAPPLPGPYPPPIHPTNKPSSTHQNYPRNQEALPPQLIELIQQLNGYIQV